MAKSKARFSEVDELSDTSALEHSRGKYARYQEVNTKGNDSDEEDGRNDVRADYKSKHTLDSDEEEDVKYRKLDVDKIEGQEEAGEEYEGETKLMAFNMQDDLEEGHFDAAGNFIFDKEEDSSTTKNFGDTELKTVYEKIASMLRPNETIERALSRFGKEKGISAAEERKKRWAAKKAGKEYTDEREVAMKELTGLADTLVSNGELEAYQYTLEKLRHLIQELESRAVDVLDMFSDAPPVSKTGSGHDYNAAKSSGDVVMWEYKLSNREDAEIIGPISSEEMMKLQQEGKFANGGWARKKGTQSFYTVARLDFEIYI